MTSPDKKNESVPGSPVIIPIPAKRGRKKKSTLPLVGFTQGSDPLILGLAGQVRQIMHAEKSSSGFALQCI